MSWLHIGLALVVAAVWGVAFAVSKIGLRSFTPPQLTVLRFAVAAIAALWLPRPRIAWRDLLLIGLTLFTGQFLLQFFAIAHGLPAGLTAVVVQAQVLLTVVFAAAAFNERPRPRQTAGIAIAVAGLAVIGFSLGAHATTLGFGLAVASATSWATGNVLVKRLQGVNMLHLIVWASLIPPLPALAISIAMDGPTALKDALGHASWAALAAPIYLGLLASVFAYAAWGWLLQRHQVAAVAPFALLTPVVGALASALLLDERFDSFQIAAMACMLVGVSIVAVPGARFSRSRGSQDVEDPSMKKDRCMTPNAHCSC